MKTRFKTLALTMVFAALMPVSLFAQSDGFFRGGESNNYDNRDGGMTWANGGSLTPNDPTAPLGSGLLVLVAAGAGYAVDVANAHYAKARHCCWLARCFSA